MLTLQITFQLGEHLLVGQNRTNTAFSRRYGSSFGKNHIYSNITLTKLLEGVFLRMNIIVCWHFVTNLHVVDTLVHERRSRKFCIVGSTGPLSLRTPTIFTNSIQDVKWRVESHVRTWCSYPNLKVFSIDLQRGKLTKKGRGAKLQVF